YHPDYLGSVEFVTDMNGNPYQFFHNTIWGENLQNHMAFSFKSFSSRYRFNGKEWDEETGNFYYGARYYDPKISVWLSVDPLATNYPYISPYNFVENNPLKFVDPTGMGPEVYIKGPDADQATQELQKKTNLTLSRDSKTGQLSASGTAKTKLDQQLLAAIESESIIVNLETTKDNSFKSRDGSTQPIRIGGYDGNEKIVEQEVIVEGIEGIMEPITMDVEKYKTTQYINMDQSAKAEKAGVSNQGSDVYHELIESYYGAIYHPGGIYNKALWNKAHNRALSDDPSAPRVQEYSNGPGQPILGLRNMLNNKRVRLP
ncbi:MAG: RHS repeat-associated core domain-containing protein, partial [Bacteroidetes bacterium]|nr:RHS repeat-associated core domain-containing protein [Bacteroidota bacterium]